MNRSPTPQRRFMSKDGPTPAERKWRPIIEEWRRSGQEASAFCRGRGLRLSAFKFWKKEIPLRDERRKRPHLDSIPRRKALRMLPVRVVESVSVGPMAVDIVLRGGHILRVGGDFDPAILRKLVATLEEPQ